jgi:endonuclease/exonuclease/phosphatase family metal-dependent hydrolase
MSSPTASVLRGMVRGLGLILLLVLLYLGSVIGYAMLTDLQPPEQMALSTEGTARARQAPDTLTVLSWNIGYAGQGAEADFFYDGGQSVRQAEPRVQQYLDGVAEQLRAWREECDLFLLQEVDLDSRRSYGIDQVSALAEALPGYAYAFAVNYQVGFIPIPLLEPMGRVKGGLTTYSRIEPRETLRYQFEGNYDWPTYLFFLDRCFLLQRFALDSSDRQLVVINTHNSAYDDGSLKKRQMAQLKAVLLAEYEQGHYVIVGGDWNQFPPTYRGIAASSVEKTPETAARFVPETYPAEGWHWAYDLSVPTNRSLARPFDPERSEQGIIDFFLVSPNVELLSVEGLDLGFADSDHQPVRLRVRL